MPASITTITSILKEYYRDVMVDLLNNKVKLRDEFQKNDDKTMSADGRYVAYPIHVTRNIGAGAISENNTLPVAGNQGLASVNVNYRYNYVRIRLSGPALEAATSNKGSFKRSMELEMKPAINDLARQINRQLWGYGVGIMCRVNGQQATGTSLNVKDAGGVAYNDSNSLPINPARYLQIGDRVVFVRNATPTSATDSDIVASSTVCDVTAISADGRTLTLGVATGATLNDNDMVVLSPAQSATQSSVNKEVMGMLGIDDDTTYLTTLHGVSRSTYPQFRSTVLPLNGDLTTRILQRAWDAADEKGGTLSTFYSHHSVRAEYLALLTNVKRFVNEGGMRPDAGFDLGAGKKEKDIEFNGVPWKVDRACPYGMIFGIEKSFNIRFVNKEGDWLDRDGTILMRVADVDAYEGRFGVFDNYHNDRPDGLVRIDGVNSTVDNILYE